jgi:SAM-dependent methyltransferase
MVVTGRSSVHLPSAAALEVIWHDLECGGYRADLALWRELAASSAAEPILEIGSGTGRVALDLASAGHRVTALDRDRRLLDALEARDGSSKVEVVCADARTFELGDRAFAMCITPMQTVQLLGGAPGRASFLSAVRAHLKPGGLLACALVCEFECFDCRDGAAGPTPETVVLDGLTYVSRAVRVSADADKMLIERERSVRRAGRTAHREQDLIALDRLSAAQLEREAVKAGLRPAAARHIAATDEHLGSEVVILHG